MITKNIRTLLSLFVVLLFTATFVSGFGIKTMAAATVFNVDSYGAVANGTTDSTSAINAAIAAAKASKQPSIVQFGSGTYLVDRDIASPTNYQADYIFDIDGIDDCTIQGAGASKTTILINNPSIGGFYIKNCTNFTVKDFTVDYKTPPFTQGTVFSANADTGIIVIDLDTGYPDFNDPMFSKNVMTGTYGMPVDKNSNKDLSRFGPAAIQTSSFTHISGNRWQINVAPGSRESISSASINKGTRYIQEAHRWIYAFYARFNKKIEMRDITIYASPSLTTSWNHNDGIIINGLNVDVKPGTTRLLSTNADGIQAFGNRGGFLIENCSFYGMSDDAISLSGKGGYLWEKMSDTQVNVNTADSFYKVGDVVQILDSINKNVRATVTVKSVYVVNQYIQTITFDKPVEGMVAVENTQAADVIQNISACDQNSIIQNNDFYSHRGRHIVMRSHDCVIQNNDFRISYGVFGGIDLEFSQEYASGPAPYNINIKNNIFTGTGPAHDNTALMMYSGTMQTGGKSRTIKNINIESNTFNNMLSKTMWISGCDTVMLKNNIINVSTSRIAGPTIYIDGSTGITIDGLTGTDANKSSRTSAVIQLTNTVEAGAKGNSAKNINYNLTAASSMERPQLISDASYTLKFLNGNSQNSAAESNGTGSVSGSSKAASNQAGSSNADGSGASAIITGSAASGSDIQNGSNSISGAGSENEVSDDSAAVSGDESSGESNPGDTADNKSLLIWIILGIVIIGGAAGLTIYLIRRRGI
ncbi:MAG: glycosyl hydrolase family 28-related protein [Saccharofermentanales bacterium]